MSKSNTKEHKLPNATSRKNKLYDVTVEADTLLRQYPVGISVNIEKSAPKGQYLVMGDPIVCTNREYGVSPWSVLHPGKFVINIFNTSPTHQSMLFKSGQVIAKAIKIG